MANFDSNIYNMSEALHDIAKHFIPEEDEETLSLGTYGFLNAVNALHLSNDIRISQENANEMFYNRARLAKNVIAYAIENGIENIYSTPATIPVVLWIRKSDLDALIEEHGGMAILDRFIPFMIGDYEFHLDYNIRVQVRKILDEEVYTAQYIMDNKNEFSSIESPYIDAPYIFKRNREDYICFNLTMRQMFIKKHTKRLMSSSSIDNKSYMFEFDNQLVAFDVYVTEGDNTTRLTPVFSGADVSNIDLFCDYTYVDDKTIRVSFNADSYMPGLNAEVETIVYTSLGADGNFTYTEESAMALQDTDDYTYLQSPILISIQSRSEGGIDARTIKELKRVLPKQALSRGNLTNNKDLDNYFNTYNTESSRLKPVKKIHNQFERMYYAYLLQKDSDNNVVPTNTLSARANIKLLEDPNNVHVKKAYTMNGNNIDHTMFTFDTDCCIGYHYHVVCNQYGNPEIVSTPIVNERGETTGYKDDFRYRFDTEFIVDPNAKLEDRPDLVNNAIILFYPEEDYTCNSKAKEDLKKLTVQQYYDKFGFLYTFPFKTVLNSEGPYISFYETVMDEVYRINYLKGNISSPLEMIATYGTWTRTYTDVNPENPTSDRYTFLVNVTQNVAEDYNLLIPIKNKALFMPIYTMMNQYSVAVVNKDGAPTGENTTATVALYYLDISELIIQCIMSDADIVLAIDSTNGSGKFIYSSMDNSSTKYYIMATTSTKTDTFVYTDYKEAYDKYESIIVDEESEYVYKKLIDSNGSLKYVTDLIGNDFKPDKIYIETHYNGSLKDDVTIEYEALIDALRESALLYATEVPTSRYTITEYDKSDENRNYGNIIYDSEVDQTNDELVFLQIKNTERTMNVRTTKSKVDNKIALLPKDKVKDEEGNDVLAYEYQVFDKTGKILEGYNTYTNNWEEYDEEKAESVGDINILDDYTDYDYELDKLYEDDRKDQRITQPLKILTINDTLGTVDSTAKYVYTLQAAVKYIARQKCSCLLYYKNSNDINETDFTRYDSDLIAKIPYTASTQRFGRFGISNIIENNRYKIVCKLYSQEANIPDDIVTELGFNDASKYIIYEFTDSIDNTVLYKDDDLVKYVDSGELDKNTRSYTVKHTVNGVGVYIESRYELGDVLSMYADSTFKTNELLRVDKANTISPLYNGVGDKEIYLLEYFNDNRVSNAYSITSRSKLAIVHKKVLNIITRLVDSRIWTDSEDVDSYINVYDLYGNKIDLDITYSGKVYNTDDPEKKCYPIHTYVGIKDSSGIKHFTNVIDALQYGCSLGTVFDIIDFNGIVRTRNFDPKVNNVIYLFTASTDFGNFYNIYYDENELIRYDGAKEYSGSTTEITQSFILTYNDTDNNYDISVRYIKDESINKDNTYVDTSTITEEANLGDITTEDSSDTGEANTGTDINSTTTNVLGDKVQTVTISDGTSMNNLSDLINIIAQHPDYTIVAILDGGTSDLDKRDVYDMGDSRLTVLYDPDGTSTAGNSGQRVEVTSEQTIRIDSSTYIIRNAAILVLYDEKDEPICYFKADIQEYNSDIYSYVYRFEIMTDDIMDRNNNILINAGIANTCSACYYPTTSNIVNRYVDANVSAKLYILGKFADQDGENLQEYGTMGLESIVDFNNLGLSGYTVMNIYNIPNGLDMFEDFSEMIHCTVNVGATIGESEEDVTYTYDFKDLPLIRKAYATNNAKITEFIKALKEKKDYIEEAQYVLENNYNIDMKFYNTYGPANIYYTLDSNGTNKKVLDRVNITLSYGVKLKKASDDYTIDYIIQDIKNAIENLDEINEYYLDNLAAELYQTYQNSIYYIEFRGLNNYDSTRRNFFIDNSVTNKYVPEFININLIVDEENATPDINIVSI